MSIVIQIFQVCIIPLLGVLTAWLCALVNKKTKEISNRTDSDVQKKYLDMLNATIVDCIEATNQTYVDALKKEGTFTKEAQQIAFMKTFNAVFAILTDDAVEYLTEGLGDLETYVTQKIEAEIKKDKKGTV